MRRATASILVLALWTAAGCDEKPSQPVESPEDSLGTWGVISDRILSPNCTRDCHAAGTSYARQSGLVLTPDVAYRQLLDVTPTNAQAAADGLKRVAGGGLPGLYTSFLWEKINAPDQAHFHSDHPYYGAQMPLGGPPLTNGELEFIRRWIVAGAPEEGMVAEEALLEDVSRYEPPAFQPLPPPASGLQFHLGPFEVAPHYERELFSYVPLDHAGDLLISQVEISMAPGSHHFIFYTFRDNTPPAVIPRPQVLRDIRDVQGRYITANLLPMAYHDFVAGTQWPLLNYTFPRGVALRLPAGKGLDMNSHYVNRGMAPITGEVYGNLHFADPDRVEHVADILFLNHDSFRLPSRRVTEVSKSFIFSERRHIFQLFSHAHEHMVEFKAEIAGGPRNGEIVYFSRDWQHPPILDLTPPLVLEPGQGLKLRATYDNWTDRELRFGLLSEDEMMILFGYYWTD